MGSMGSDRPLNPYVARQKSVQIAEQKPVILGIRDKHGPLYNAIPKMPIAVAAICCIFNILVPGFGTFISAFTVLCGAPTIIGKRILAFSLNLLSAFLQLLTFLLIIGWVWSILWGMNMVQLALNGVDTDEKKPSSYYCRRQSSIDVP